MNFKLPAKILIASLCISVGALAQDAPEGVAKSDDLPTIETIELSPTPDLQQDRLNAVEDYLNGVATMRARFVQRAPDGTLSRGIFHMERPGRIRFEYDGDVPILIVADGRTLNLVDYELGQVTKWPIDDSPLALLVAEHISLDKNVTLVSSGPGGLANMISITASDPKKPEHGTMTLIFSVSLPASLSGSRSPKDGESDANTQISGQVGGSVGDDGDVGAMRLTLRGWQVKDSKGVLTTVSLSEPELNLPLAASLWAFDDPRSARFGKRRRNR